MKKYLLSIILAILLFASPSQAGFIKDVIVTSPNAIWTDSRAYATLADAIAAVGANEREIVVAKEEVCTALTIPANVHLKFTRAGSITNSGQLTINTQNISAGDYQIFTGTGDIDFASGSIVRSTWFSNLDEALDVTNDDTLAIIISESATTTADMAVGNNVSLRWDSPFIITVDAGHTVSNIKNIESGHYQIFAGAGEFNFLAGTILNSIWFSHLKTAIDYIGTDEVTLEITHTEILDDDRTVNANTTLSIFQGGIVSIDGGITFTIDGQIVAPLVEIFGGAGAVTYNGNGIWYTDWENVSSIPLIVNAAEVDIGTGKLNAGDGRLEIPNSITLPATCTVGEIYMDNDAVSGQQCYFCGIVDTWIPLKTFINVAAFTGTDRAKIQAAINEAQTNGGIVYIPKGVWTVDDHDTDGHCLEITAAVTIIGDNRHNTYVKSADNNASIFHINTTAAVHISGFCIENTAASPTTGAHGITVTSSTNNNYSTFKDLILKNNDIGIAFLNATHCGVRNCVFSSANTYGILINNSYTVDSGEISIIGSFFTGNPDSQIRIESGGGSRLVSNNIWSGSYGVDVAVRNGTTTSVLTMVGNKFEGQYTNSIILRNYPSGTTGIYEKIAISGNEFCENCDSHGSTGLSINGHTTSTFRTIAITGNVMRGGGIDVGKCAYITITGNTIEKSTVSRTYGINFTAVPAGNVVIGGNSISGFTQEIGGTAVTPIFPCSQVRIQEVAPRFWLDETGAGNKGANFVLDNKVFQIQRRAQRFGAYEAAPFYLDLTAPNLAFYIDEVGHVGFGKDPTTKALDMNIGGGYCTAGGVWTDGSSREYKTNIRDLNIKDALSTLTALSPIRYNPKSEMATEYLGFIAEDVPDLVASGDRKGMSPMNIVAVLTKVAQEHQKNIVELCEKTEEQSLYILQLHERLKTLELLH